MSYLVFDIETIGKPYDEPDDTTKKYFKQWAERGAQTDDEVENYDCIQGIQDEVKNRDKVI